MLSNDTNFVFISTPCSSFSSSFMNWIDDCFLFLGGSILWEHGLMKLLSKFFLLSVNSMLSSTPLWLDSYCKFESCFISFYSSGDFNLSNGVIAYFPLHLLIYESNSEDEIDFSSSSSLIFESNSCEDTDSYSTFW